MSDIQQINQYNDIKKLLESQKFYIFLSDKIVKIGEYQYIHVQDCDSQEYTIQIIPLSENENERTVQQYKLIEAKLRAKQLRYCNHPQIIKYYDEFQIQNYYFILIERFNLTMQDWMMNKRDTQIEKMQFIRIILDVLSGILFLHQKKLNLRESPLKAIVFNNDLQIKICDFGLSRVLDSFFVMRLFQNAEQNKELFYLLPQYLKMKQYQQLKMSDEGDFWAVIICMYYLTGVSTRHIAYFIQGIENYKPYYNLGIDVNTILLNLLIRKQYDLQLFSIPNVIQSFKNVMNNNQKSQQDLNKDKQIEQSQIVQIQSHNEEIQVYIDDFIQVFKLIQQKQFQEALPLIQKCLQKNKDSDILNFFMSRIYSNIQNISNSYEYYGQAIKLNSQNDHTFINIGVLYRNDNQGQKSIECYKKAIQINKYKCEAHFNLGLEYNDLRKNKQALISFKKAIQLNPKQCHDAFWYIVRCYLENGQYQKAINCFQKSSYIKPNYDDQISLKRLKKII